MPENNTNCIHKETCKNYLDGPWLCLDESCEYYSNGKEYYQKGYDDANEEWKDKLDRAFKKLEENDG